MPTLSLSARTARSGDTRLPTAHIPWTFSKRYRSFISGRYSFAILPTCFLASPYPVLPPPIVPCLLLTADKLKQTVLKYHNTVPSLHPAICIVHSPSLLPSFVPRNPHIVLMCVHSFTRLSYLVLLHLVRASSPNTLHTPDVVCLHIRAQVYHGHHMPSITVPTVPATGRVSASSLGL